MEAGDATSESPIAADDANQVGEHLKSITWKPFAQLDHFIKSIIDHRIEFGESRIKQTVDRLENHSNSSISNDLRHARLESDARTHTTPNE